MSLPDSPFPETRWSLVHRMRTPVIEADGAAAMEELCRLYWRPIYVYARRGDRTREDAEDITQAFFASLLERGTLAQADAERGRLRTFLLSAFRRFSVSHWRHAHRKRRAGNIQFCGLDVLETVVLSQDTGDEIYDRAWAQTIVNEAESIIEQDYQIRGRAELYHQLRPLLAWDSAPDGTTAVIAGICRMTPGAVRVSLKRLREAWRRELEKQVALTVSETSAVADEVRYLLRVWGAVQMR